MSYVNNIDPAETKEDRRSSKRHVAVILVAKLSGDFADSICRIKNISTSGVLLETNVQLNEGQQVSVELRSDLHSVGQVVWSKNGHAGVEFIQPIDVARYLMRPGHKLERVKARAPRYRCRALATLIVDGIGAICTINDIALSGARLGNLPKGLVLRPNFAVKLQTDGISSRHANIVWCNQEYVGIKFRHPVRYTELRAWLEINHGLPIKNSL